MTTEQEHLFLVNDVEYNTNLDEMDYFNRYYLYAEYVISPRSDVTTWNVTITLGDSGKVDTAQYANSRVLINGNVANKTITVSAIYDNGNGEMNVGSSTFDYGVTDPMVISIMILPKLNVLLNNSSSDVDATTDLANMCVFHDGHQVLFSTSSDSPMTTLIPLLKFFKEDTDDGRDINSDKYIPSNKMTYTSSGVHYTICNTEFDKFKYQHLALMCYDEYDLNTVYASKRNVFAVPVMNYGSLNVGKTGMSDYKSYTPFLQKLRFDTSDDTNGIKFYCEIYVSGYWPGSTGGSYNTLVPMLVQVDYDHFNLFDAQYREVFSNLSDSKFPECTNIQQNIVSSIFSQTLSIPVRKDDMSGLGSCLVVFTVEKDSNGYYTRYKVIDRSNIDINIPSDITSIDDITIKRYDEIEYNIPIEFDDILTRTSINSNIDYLFMCGNNPLYASDGQTPTGYVRFEVNCGEKKFHTIPSGYENDDFFKRTQKNDSWKQLWKYGREMSFFSDLQDNPVILPVRVMNNSTDNMFVEFVLESAPTLNDGVCFGIIDKLDFGGVYDTDPGITAFYNGFTFAIYPSTSYSGKFRTEYKVFKEGQNVYEYEHDNLSLPIAVMFYNTSGKTCVKQNSGEEDTHLKTESVDLTLMKNIYIHGNGSCDCLLNFGPDSDYFQEYIDNLLDQDGDVTINILTNNIVSGKEFYNLADLTGGGE